MAGLKGLRKRRRVQIVAVAAVALTLSTALIGYAMRDGISFFRSPAQLAANPPSASEVFRVGGLVKTGTLDHSTDPQFTFTVTDGAADIAVKYVGADLPPDLFKEGEGTVATGRYVNGIFLATNLLAKHDEKYMPKEVIDALKKQGVYVPPSDRSASN